MSRNDFICQLLADLTGVTVKRSNLEMSTLGAAYFAGLSCGKLTIEAILKLQIVDNKVTQNGDSTCEVFA